VKKVYEGKSEGIDVIYRWRHFWNSEYHGIEFYKGQGNIKQRKEAVQEIPQTEKIHH